MFAGLIKTNALDMNIITRWLPTGGKTIRGKRRRVPTRGHVRYIILSVMRFLRFKDILASTDDFRVKSSNVSVDGIVNIFITYYYAINAILYEWIVIPHSYNSSQCLCFFLLIEILFRSHLETKSFFFLLISRVHLYIYCIHFFFLVRA